MDTHTHTYIYHDIFTFWQTTLGVIQLSQVTHPHTILPSSIFQESDRHQAVLCEVWPLFFGQAYLGLVELVAALSWIWSAVLVASSHRLSIWLEQSLFCFCFCFCFYKFEIKEYIYGNRLWQEVTPFALRCLISSNNTFWWWIEPQMKCNLSVYTAHRSTLFSHRYSLKSTSCFSDHNFKYFNEFKRLWGLIMWSQHSGHLSHSTGLRR